MHCGKPLYKVAADFVSLVRNNLSKGEELAEHPVLKEGLTQAIAEQEPLEVCPIQLSMCPLAYGDADKEIMAKIVTKMAFDPDFALAIANLVDEAHEIAE